MVVCYVHGMLARNSLGGDGHWSGRRSHGIGNYDLLTCLVATMCEEDERYKVEYNESRKLLRNYSEREVVVLWLVGEWPLGTRASG